MPNPITIDKMSYNGNTYKFQDNVSDNRFFGLSNDNNSWINITPTTADVDLDIITTAGNYYFTTNKTGTGLTLGKTIQNMPDHMKPSTIGSTAGFVKVLVLNESIVYQLICGNNSTLTLLGEPNKLAVYIRKHTSDRSDDSWSEWIELTNVALITKYMEHEVPDYSLESSPDDNIWESAADYQTFLMNCLEEFGYVYDEDEQAYQNIPLDELLNNLQKMLVTKVEQIYVTLNSTEEWVDENYVAKAGSTMTGLLTLSGDPTANMHAATKQYVDNEIISSFATQDAMIFKGTLNGATTTTYTPAANRGHTYKVATAGLINGEAVEIGDVLICTTDDTVAATSSNVSTVKNNWVIIQTNLDGAVIGPASATNNRIALFDGTSGKLIKDGSNISIADNAVVPSSNNSIDLGSSSKKFKDIYGTLKGNANTATTLATGRTLKVSLGSINASTAFDGSANITDIGVSGTLPIAQGGTGATSGSSALNNDHLIGDINADNMSTTLTDDTVILTSSTYGFNDQNKGLFKRNLTGLYNYIKGKTDSLYATTGHTHTTSLTTTTTGTSSITLDYDGKYKLTTGGTDLIFTMPASDNTDENVTQSASTTSNWRKVLLHYTSSSTFDDAVPETTTNQVYAAQGIEVSPNKGKLRVNNLLVATGAAANTANTGIEFVKVGTDASTTGLARIGSSGSNLALYSTGSIILRPTNTATGFDGSTGFSISSTAITPAATNTIDIGTSTYKFKNIYGTLKGNADTTTQAYVTKVNDATQYYPVFSVIGSGNANLKNTDQGFSITQKVGTTSVKGWIELHIGNNTASGTANNRQGWIKLYGPQAYGTEISNLQETANNFAYLPNYNGTIYFAHTGSADAVGSDTTPAYVAANGRLTACTNNTAVKVKISATAPTTATNRRIVLTTANTGDSQTLYNNENGAIIRILTGTTSVNGYNALILGNSTATGTANNSEGYIRLYGTGSKYTDIKASNASANRTITFPNASGTVALTSDIPTITTGSSNPSGGSNGDIYLQYTS